MTINNKFEAKDLAIFLKKNIEWKLFKSLLEHLGNSLNDRKGRFMKSDLIEYSLEIFSNQKVIHIDEQGRDLKIPEKNCYCEVKFEKQLIFTERGPQNASGRTRALVTDKSDATGNTYLAASIGGGIWRGVYNPSTLEMVWSNLKENRLDSIL